MLEHTFFFPASPHFWFLCARADSVFTCNGNQPHNAVKYLASPFLLVFPHALLLHYKDFTAPKSSLSLLSSLSIGGKAGEGGYRGGRERERGKASSLLHSTV